MISSFRFEFLWWADSHDDQEAAHIPAAREATVLPGVEAPLVGKQLSPTELPASISITYAQMVMKGLP